MAQNSFEYADWLSMDGLFILENSLVVGQFFDSNWDKDFRKDFPIGENVRIPLPWKPQIRTGLVYTPQAISRIHKTATMDQVFGIDFEWNDVEAALKLVRGRAQIRKDYLEPSTTKMAQDWDSRHAKFAAIHASNFVGTLGSTPTTFQSTSGAARRRLQEMGCPPGGDRGMIVSPAVEESLVAVSSNSFNPTSEISRQYREGSLGRQGGFDWYSSMSLYLITAGVRAGNATAGTLTGAATNGQTSITIACTTGDTFYAGEKFDFGAGVYAVNPETQQAITLTRPKTFSIVPTQNSDGTYTELYTAVGSAVTFPITPAIYGPTSPYQNVTALPANGATITMWPGTASPNGKSGYIGLAIRKGAYAHLSMRLETPSAVEIATQQRDPDSGMNFRFVRAWDPELAKMTNRFDTGGGFGELYNDNCVVAVLC